MGALIGSAACRATAHAASTSHTGPRFDSAAGPASGAADLESRIGSQWLNRIGITALLIGVSYFLKFAFDNNWIGPAGRVAIGLFLGIMVVVWSEWFRGRGHKAFSYSLKAVGLVRCISRCGERSSSTT